VHVEDAAEVLPHAGRNGEDETEREDRVAEHRAGAPTPDGSVRADLRAIAPRHQHADGEAESENERQRLDEYEVVRELVAPRLRAGRGLADGRHDTERSEGQAGHDEEPGDDPHVLTGAGLRLALSRTALERLERAQLVPRLFRRRGGIEAQPPRLGLDDPLTDPDVDRAALDTRRPTLAPEAQVALREGIRRGVVCDA